MIARLLSITAPLQTLARPQSRCALTRNDGQHRAALVAGAGFTWEITPSTDDSHALYPALDRGAHR